LLCDTIRPPSVKETKPLYLLEDEDEGSNDGSIPSNAKESSDQESYSDTDTDSNMDMEVDDGQITDKIAIIQEWLFSDPLPNFSRNDLIIEYLTDDVSLEYFFKFIVCPFKSMIHHVGKKKYMKHTHRLKVNLKKTIRERNMFIYTPKKHNVYYFRS
jgi:hypothetical protein